MVGTSVATCIQSSLSADEASERPIASQGQMPPA